MASETTTAGQRGKNSGGGGGKGRGAALQAQKDASAEGTRQFELNYAFATKQAKMQSEQFAQQLALTKALSAVAPARTPSAQSAAWQGDELRRNKLATFSFGKTLNPR